MPPLDFPLLGVELPSTLPDYVEPGVTKITMLGNGLRIASETSPVSVLVSFEGFCFYGCCPF